jgi:hypothetical protein
MLTIDLHEGQYRAKNAICFNVEVARLEIDEALERI